MRKTVLDMGSTSPPYLKSVTILCLSSVTSLLIYSFLQTLPSQNPPFLVNQTELWYISGSPKLPIGNHVKHSLIILISLLLLSSPLFGQSNRPETIIVPVSGIGDVSNTRKLILENTLTNELTC